MACLVKNPESRLLGVFHTEAQADQTLLRLDTHIYISHGSAYKTWPSKVVIIQCTFISHLSVEAQLAEIHTSG